MKIGFCTLGCKVNQYETEAIKELFLNNGWEIGEFSDFCDAYLINTCTVTHLSDRKSRQMIRRANSKNPDAVIAVCGCYAQMSPLEVEEIEGVDIVIGTKNKLKAYELIVNKVRSNIVCPVEKEDYEDMEITLFESKTRAIIKAQDGCNNFCAYCIIPYARGRIRSRNLESIYNECVRLSQNGFLEVVLAGIHICSYGKDLENTNLITLLTKIHEIDKIKRIRLSSIEPNAFTDEFIDALKNLPKVCHHFHISLQSGCDETLKRMNRRYDTHLYKSICEKLIKEFSDSAITTDLIVGFPGEDEEEFNKTLNFIKEIPFYQIHTFKYSKREGTKAAGMENQVPSFIKDERSKKVLKISKEKSAEFEKSYIGKEVEILTETISANGMYMGHTSNYLPVYINSKEDIKDKLIKVKITHYEDNMLMGEIINKENQL
ncbi:MAG: tRNA (N(6)-L-threonylcarbamoyladenosine(37)-C(2))-methylthiotransferase MtaB [Ruminococcaceae bacterium]|nr:tRNA (N(6)-L-threonylcarbamoyladenosine(37)-C(2))-methylthiotransferase MtaB [Oscillospiraceae bacterium]